MARKSKDNLFNHYLVSFFGVISVSVALVVTIVFFVYANLQTQSVRSYSISQLEQVCSMTDILYDQMRSISNQILQSASTNRCLSTVGFNRLQEASAAIKLREIQTANPNVRYVSFYNSASNRFVSNSTVDFLDDADIDYYYSSLGSKLDTCTLRLVGANYATQTSKTQYVYSFIFPLQVRNSGDTDLAIIDVDVDYFSQAIHNLRTTDGFQQVILVNRENIVFSANTFNENSDDFVLSTNNASINVENMPELTGTSGYFSQKLDNGMRALVTYARSASSGFTILNIIPYSEIYSSLPLIALLTLLSGILVLAVGIFISYRTSLRLSAPIEVLYRNYVQKPSGDRSTGNELEELGRAFSEMYAKTDKLEQGLISSYSDSKKRYVQRLLHGEFEQIPNHIEVYRSFGIDLLSPFYCIVMIHCVSAENQITPDDSNYFICNYALENITTEVVGQFGSICTYRNTKNMLAVLLSLPQNAYPDQIESELQRIVTVMKQEFSMETTICIGNIVEASKNINMCYEATTIALEHSAIQRHGKVFFADDAVQRLNLNQYHNKLHIKLAEHIRKEDLDACEQEFDLALSYMTNVSFATAVTYFNHVMMSLMDDFSTTFTDDTSYNLLIDKLNQINRSLPNVHMLRHQCMEFVTLLTHHLSIHHKNGNEQAAETARAYIDKNFSNPDLSLRMLADLANLSPAYFGKIFTAHTGLSFNDYLTNTRMQKAAQLLLESKLPINQVSEAIGITNTNYFYSVFKKKFGMTPLAYRRSGNHSEDPAK